MSLPSTASEYLTLAQATHYFPSRPARNTLLRWCTIGCYGVKLRSIRCGHKRMFTKEMCDEFLRELNGDAPPKPRAKSAYQVSNEARLDSVGV